MNTPGIYEGFSPRMRVAIVSVAALIALLNLGASWYVAGTAISSLKFSDQDAKYIQTIAADLVDVNQRVALRIYATNTQAHLKGIVNKQAIIIVCFGSAFAFMAIGFALFLIGADGAFKFQAATDQKANLLLSSTAPGLACFLFAAVLIGIGVTTKYELNIGAATIETNSDTRHKSEAQSSQGCSKTNEGDCIKDEALNGLQ
jgi:hypothetical protein